MRYASDNQSVTICQAISVIMLACCKMSLCSEIAIERFEIKQIISQTDFLTALNRWLTDIRIQLSIARR